MCLPNHKFYHPNHPASGINIYLCHIEQNTKETKMA